MERMDFKALRAEESLKIEGGEISLSFFCYKKFIGSTSGGEYPPANNSYDEFSCKPKRGQRGTLAFGEDDILQFYWKRDKLVVGPKVEYLARYGCLSRSKEYGIVIQIGRLSYVTKLPSNLNSLVVSEQEGRRLFRKVDLLDMLKYIEGQYGLKELDKSVREQGGQVKTEAALLDAARSEIFNCQILLGDILGRCWWLGARLQNRIESRINSLMQIVKELGENYSR